MTSEKKPSVPKKGVAYEKPSILPEEEAFFASSLGAKKGADPVSSTPSVFPRKGVELSQGDPILLSGSPGNDLLSVSDKGIDNTNVLMLSSGSTVHKNVQTESSDIESELGDEKGSSNFSKTLVAVIPSVKVSNNGHFKPTTADDPSASSSQVSYAPIFMIVILVVLVIIVVAVGYHRLKDIWARRHYNYVDFLIDGMYE